MSVTFLDTKLRNKYFIFNKKCPLKLQSQDHTEGLCHLCQNTLPKNFVPKKKKTTFPFLLLHTSMHPFQQLGNKKTLPTIVLTSFICVVTVLLN